MLTFYKNWLVYLLRGLLYNPVLLKSQGLNQDYTLTVGSDFFHDCSSDASVGEAYPTAPLLFSSGRSCPWCGEWVRNGYCYNCHTKI